MSEQACESSSLRRAWTTGWFWTAERLLCSASRRSAKPLATSLLPHVPHDGRSASPNGFPKRVLYLDDAILEPSLTGSAVDHLASLIPFWALAPTSYTRRR